jgi:hypothetical protein
MLAIPLQLEAVRSEPLVWSIDEFEQMREDLSNNKTAISIIKEADVLCADRPVVITDKVLFFGTNRHFYNSIGPYWWPDPEKKGRFIRKDGEVNPDSKNYDREKLAKLATNCKKLSIAFYLTQNIKYYDAYIKQIRAWFIDEDTYMIPSFEFAQVIPGQHNNKGRSTGMIDAYSFNIVLESIRLVDYVKRIDRRTMTLLRQWFLEFAEWSEDTYGKTMRNGKQNISIAYDVTMINMYIFAGKNKKAKILADAFAKRKLYVQVDKDGSQPAELARTNAFSYSLSNLTRIIDFCYLVRKWDKSYYKKHADRIDKAVAFLQQYADNPKSFPYQQKSSWNDCIKKFNTQKKRLEKLK